VLYYNNIIQVTVLIVWAPSNCNSKIAKKSWHEAPKRPRTLQPNIRISGILQIYHFHYKNYVQNIKIYLMELCKC
jgi:hypothetical protein